MRTSDKMISVSSLPSTRIRRRTLSVTLAVTLLLALSACSAIETRSGYVPREDQIAEIKPGVQTQKDVRRILGSPSSVASFEKRRDVWYYISGRTETLAFLAPKIVEQNVLAIEFGNDGRVSDVRRYDLQDGRKIELVKRETPTRGREFGFFEQLFGNIGRFSSSK